MFAYELVLDDGFHRITALRLQLQVVGIHIGLHVLLCIYLCAYLYIYESMKHNNMHKIRVIYTWHCSRVQKSKKYAVNNVQQIVCITTHGIYTHL
jgi:uncharacterized membrane protein